MLGTAAPAWLSSSTPRQPVTIAFVPSYEQKKESGSLPPSRLAFRASVVRGGGAGQAAVWKAANPGQGQETARPSPTTSCVTLGKSHNPCSEPWLPSWYSEALLLPSPLRCGRTGRVRGSPGPHDRKAQSPLRTG